MIIKFDLIIKYIRINNMDIIKFDTNIIDIIELICW